MKDKTIDKVVGIILAAGASTRMGRPKQLLKIRDGFLLDKIFNEADNSELDHIVIVLGCQAEEIQESLKIGMDGTRSKIIVNSKWKNGMSSSIIRGLLEVEDKYNQCMIILADMPFITSDLINRLMKEYLASGLDLGAIKTGNRSSPPVIFSRSLYPEFHELKGDMGGRNILNRYPDRICLVDSKNDYMDMDINTPDDYLNYKRLNT